MISLNDVLLAMSNIPVDDPIAEIWGRGLQDGYKIIEYTGTLPITINADGNALIDYRIYGADGGVGVPTENLLDKRNSVYGKYLKPDGLEGTQSDFAYTDFLKIDSSTSYTLKDYDGIIGGTASVCFYDTNFDFLYGINYNSRPRVTFTTEINVAYARCSYKSRNMVSLTLGSTAPVSYIPYGYKLPMVVHSELKDIGDTVSVNGALWDIVNYNNDFTRATLLRHEMMPDMVYSAKQAIFAFPSGLAAGDYHFTIAQHSWVSTDVGKTLTFTLTQAIPEGGQLALNGAYNATLVGTTISAYASPTATTATETVTMTEGDSGTDLGSLTNAGTPASNINSLQKALLGSNEWKTSALRQYLNSDTAAGSVWTPQTIYDRPPAWATNTAGFMNGLDEDFLSCVADTTYVTVRNTVSDGGGTDTFTDKFYLPSRTEIFGNNEIINTPEGTLYQYYVNAANADRIKYRANTARSWRLRTPSAPSAHSVRIVSTEGALNYNYAGTALDFAPACQIDLTKLSNSWLQNNMYKVGATTTPVYIGENQLDANEYVSYREQKIYKRTENLFDINRERSDAFTLDPSYYIYGGRADNKTATKNITIIVTDNKLKVGTTAGALAGAGAGFIIPVLSDTTYTLSYNKDVSVTNDKTTAALNFIDNNEQLGTVQGLYGNTGIYTFTTESTTKYVYIVFRTIGLVATYSNIMLIKGSTAPEQYIPYLQPTDPPAPLPEIPTIDGTTIIDYDGDPKPSQMYVKYKGKE